MKIGTPILTARKGKVLVISANRLGNCKEDVTKQYKQHVIVMHSDGTYAFYGNIKKKKMVCKLGDRLQKSQLIGYSTQRNNSGTTALHFSCFLGGKKRITTIPNLFKIAVSKVTSGETLSFSAIPNKMKINCIKRRGCCGKNISAITTCGYERRQVFDIPPIEMLVTEH